jgi:hypothetical protein
MLPLILLPLAAQAVTLLPRPWAAAMCVLVIAGIRLIGIRERAEQLGGTAAYRSLPGQGFTLDVELPA